MGHEYITRKYMEVLKNKNHCKKGGTFIKFFEGDKQNNRFGAKLYKTLIVANSLFPYENLRYIVTIKRILLVKLETDAREVYTA